MEESEKDSMTLPKKENILTRKCAGCGLKSEMIFEPEQREFNSILNREMLVMPAGWIWRDEKKTFKNSGGGYRFKDEYCESCLQLEIKKKDDAVLEKRRAERRLKVSEAVGGDLNYEKFTFDKYEPFTDSQREAFKACKNFDPENDNLMLVGEAGIGKTHLATATLREKFVEAGGGARYRVTELLRLLRYKRSAEEEEKLIQEFIDLPILLIEDFGVQKTTDWSTQMLWEILDRRIESGRNGLLITSNTGRGKIAEAMGDKITSRISALCSVIKIEGIDMRNSKKERRPRENG